ncbi:MAG: tRNA threonylcarbamoyladenosine dehydratase [Clostridia bacterium]|nr:tRNA threonylcarbamoyladenosine dehydratase [Clostridia bacterium]
MDLTVRSRMLIGDAGIEKLKNSSVIVFGAGGVGGFTVEALCRSGVGKITVVDGDTVAESNLNRQIIADVNSVGQIKTEVLKRRAESINPDVKFTALNIFYSADNADAIDFSNYDYVIDAVDTVSAKLLIIEKSRAANVKVISSMGTGGKLNPERLKVAYIEDTNYCPLAKVMRRELKKRGIEKVKVVYSDEQPVKTSPNDTDQSKADGKAAPPSMIFVPASAGLLIAAEVVKDLIK